MLTFHIYKLLQMYLVQFCCVVLIVSSVVEESTGKCEYGCPEPTMVYNHLNCTPIYKHPSDCCPTKYDCTSFIKRPRNMCHLMGRYYKKHQSIPDEIVSGTYNTGCRCFEFDGTYEILCGSILCPEFTGKFKSKDCMPKYNMHTPCAVGEMCPIQEHIPSKVINGISVYENQKFNKEPCKLCVYQKGYNDSFPFCKESCMPELTSSEFIDDFCAPVYISKFDCCPVEWICPIEEDIDKNAKVGKSLDTCIFGNTRLNKGDKFERAASSIARTPVECECIIPPFVTCYWEN